MQPIDYYVYYNDPQWVLEFNGKQMAFETKDQTLHVAIAAATYAGKRGYSSRVLTHGSNGEWKTDWMYEKAAKVSEAERTS